MNGPGIDPSREFVPVSIAILTVSDTRTEETDHAGRALASRIEEAGHHVATKLILADDRDLIEAQLQAWIAHPSIDVVIITGGTGIAERGVTPDAMFSVCEKDLPGFGETFRAILARSVGLAAIHSRAMAGVANGTFLFALPESISACREAWDEILKWQLDSRYRPSNLVELIPRLYTDTP